LVTVLRELSMLINIQLKSVQQIDDILGTQIISAFAQTSLAIDLIQMTHLKFGAISASFAGLVDHLNGALKAAIVVVADLSYHEGATSADFKLPDVNSHRTSLS
jgi:hypothetical protein